VKKSFIKVAFILIAVHLAISLLGCTAFKRKFTRKKKEEKVQPYFELKKYNVKPSLDLYEKHYVYWVNWQRTLISELGKNFKKDKRCIGEIIANLRDMQGLLVDDKAALLEPHIEDLNKTRLIIDKRIMTKANETRIRKIIEREYRVIKRKFSPRKMEDFIRADFKREGA